VLPRGEAGSRPAVCDVRVRDLLDSASGLDWSEGYEHGGLQASSVLAMLYGEGHRDMARFVLSHRRAAAPGTVWRYSSGDAVALSAVLACALGEGCAPPASASPRWPFDALFAPLGMASAVMERDAQGTPVGSSYLHATPRDLARLGYLYLHDGCWAGAEVLSGGWVAAATQPSAPFRLPGGARRARDGAMGRGLWTNRAVPEVGLAALPWPGAPEDAYALRGHWGQEIVVVPSQDLVLVRTADDREAGVLDLGKLVALALAAGRLP
jgi:CubicO group peptidase (beta-lactamase class C family)